MKQNIECPTCQQAIELNLPAAGTERRSLTAAAIVIGIIAGFVGAAFPVISHDHAVARNRAAIAAMVDPPRVAPVITTAAAAAGTNWSYEVMDGREEDGYGFTYWVSKRQFPGIVNPAANERDGSVEEPEATILDYMGERGWELINTRTVEHRIIWSFKRPSK